MANTVKVPLQGSNRTPQTREATYHPDCEGCNKTHIPREAAQELDLTPDTPLTVEQFPLRPRDDATIAKAAMNEHQVIDDPVRLLQAVVNHTVEESNFGLPDEYNVGQIDGVEFFWFLYQWIGAQDVMRRITNAGGEVEEFKKKSGTR